MINRPLFENGQVRLTALDPEKDAETLSRFTQDPAFVKHYFDGIYRPYMMTEIKKKIKEMLKKAADSRSYYYFAVREKLDGRLVGMVKLGYLVGSNQSTWLYVDMIDEQVFDAHSRAVLRMVLEYAFMELSLHRVSVHLPAYRTCELEMYEEAGFLRESQRRQAVFHNGEYHDELVYSLLRPEWKKLLQEVA